MKSNFIRKMHLQVFLIVFVLYSIFILAFASLRTDLFSFQTLGMHYGLTFLAFVVAVLLTDPLFSILSWHYKAIALSSF